MVVRVAEVYDSARGDGDGVSLLLPSPAMTVKVTGEEKFSLVLLRGEMVFPLYVITGIRLVVSVKGGRLTKMESPESVMTTSPTLNAVLSDLKRLRESMDFRLSRWMTGGGVPGSFLQDR
ncbi:hypothetical protein ACQ86N_30905 [Puia sp. P3]|uniref:hypothetical protein n=1 Tax=Puia sp. P3 TaxID=3423952 RepID=UPI003D67AC41